MRPLLLLAALAAALPAGAQQARDEASLDSVFRQVVTLWERGAAAAMTELAVADGLALELDGRTMGPLPARQAAAVLRRLFDHRETLSVTPGMRGQMAGDPGRGFGEFEWVVRLPGTTVPQRSTIFLALRREAERWRITQIRVLR